MHLQLQAVRICWAEHVTRPDACCAAGSAHFEDLIRFMEEFLDESFMEYMKLKLPDLVQSMLTLAANAPDWQVWMCSNVKCSAACMLECGSTACNVLVCSSGSVLLHSCSVAVRHSIGSFSCILHCFFYMLSEGSSRHRQISAVQSTCMLQGEPKLPESVSECILTKMRILSKMQGHRDDVPRFLTGLLLLAAFYYAFRHHASCASVRHACPPSIMLFCTTAR